MSANQSVDRALSILWILNGAKQATVTEIARELEVHKSTASRLLSALEHQSLVVRRPDDLAYELGQGILQLAGSVNSQNDLTKSAQLLVETVAQHFKLTANVAVLDEIYAVNIAQSAPSERFFTPRQYVGRRTPGHATSSGKVLLAAAPDDIRKQLVHEPLERFTQWTITEKQELLNELTIVKEQGWAASNNEWDADMTAVAVPLHGIANDVIAAVTITGFTHDLPSDEFTSLAEDLTQIVQRFGRLLE
ncbi:MAG TPA: IclR family transcriptional regulator [Candidatus Yaniella excrementavium]|nr:IclR family transcriptional regulator [Candidatus Yaniella excrementavium]